jgi:hypothetical protein
MLEILEMYDMYKLLGIKVSNAGESG